MHGVLSLELADSFTGMDFDPALPVGAEPDELDELSASGACGRPRRAEARRSGHRAATWPPTTPQGARYGVRKPRKVTCLRVTKPSFS